MTPKEQVARRRKKSYTIAKARRLNLKVEAACKEYMEEKDAWKQDRLFALDTLEEKSEIAEALRSDLATWEIQKYHLRRLTRSLGFSCSEKATLWRNHLGDAKEYVCSIDSGHKLDNARAIRVSRKLRRSYYEYFEKNRATGYTGKRDKETGGDLLINFFEECDFMHLVLTVPHNGDGAFGNKFYVKEILKCFNLLRKYPFWKDYVIGGELNTEIVSKGENGLHIHIHSLLLVKSFRGNRNWLYRLIFKTWNALTANCGYKREEFSEQEIKQFTENVKLTESDIQGLQKSGSTICWLESLYTVADTKLSNAHRYDENLKKWKRYCSKSDPTEMMAGVMECLKYNFEPFALFNDDGSVNCGLIAEVLPHMYRQPLYRKFGLFHGVKELNVNEEILTVEDAIEEAMENAQEVYHPETLEKAEVGEYYYFMADPSYCYHEPGSLKPMIAENRIRLFPEQPETLRDAIALMMQNYLHPKDRMKERNEEPVNQV